MGESERREGFDCDLQENMAQKGGEVGYIYKKLGGLEMKARKTKKTRKDEEMGREVRNVGGKSRDPSLRLWQN